MKIISKIIWDAPAFDEFEDFKKHVMKESGLKGESFFKPLRYLLIGAGSGPEVSDIYPLIKSYILEVAS